MANAVSSTRLKPSASVRLSVRPPAHPSVAPGGSQPLRVFIGQVERGPGWLPLRVLGSGNQPGVRGAGRSPPTAAESLRTEFRRQSASRQRARGTQERTAESREPRREKPQSARLLEEKPAVVWGEQEREGGRAPRSPHPGEVTPPRRGHPTPARSKQLCQASPGRFSTSRFRTLPSGLLAWRR